MPLSVILVLLSILISLSPTTSPTSPVPASYTSVTSAAFDPCLTLKLPPPLPPPSSILNYITAAPFFSALTLPKYTVSSSFKIQNSRAVTRTLRHHHITPILKSLHWLKIPERIHFKVLSLPTIPCSLPSPHTFANSSPFSQHPLLDHHPFSTSGHFSSHVFQPSHINHCTTSLEWPTTYTPHHFFASTAVIPNHKTSSSSDSSIRHPQGLPLKIKISSLQSLLP